MEKEMEKQTPIFFSVPKRTEFSLNSKLLGFVQDSIKDQTEHPIFSTLSSLGSTSNSVISEGNDKRSVDGTNTADVYPFSEYDEEHTEEHTGEERGEIRDTAEEFDTKVSSLVELLTKEEERESEREPSPMATVENSPYYVQEFSEIKIPEKVFSLSELGFGLTGSVLTVSCVNVPDNKVSQSGGPLARLQILSSADIPAVDPKWTVLEIATKTRPAGWDKIFRDAYHELKDVSEILSEQEKAGFRYFPSKENLFRAFHITPLNTVKVVILGQDPYHTTCPDGRPMATGLSFSVPKDAPIPSSLRNIYTELSNSITGFKTPRHGDLTYWSVQGILLLNTCLTVKPHMANSHGKIWQGLIVRVLNAVCETNPNTVFILLGKFAQGFIPYLGDRVTILEATHPSGLSANRGFHGCGVFKKTNEVLISKGKQPIDWGIND